MSSRNKKFNSQLWAGIVILSLYLVWILYWIYLSYIVKGSFDIPYLPSINISNQLTPPFSNNYLLGTDNFGRSLFETLSVGLNYSLMIGLGVSFLCAFIGIVIGYLSVTGPTWIRALSNLFTDIIFIFPGILLAILIMSITGQSVLALYLVLVVTGWPGYARLTRGETKRVMGLDFVESARAVGYSKTRMLFSAILPNILPVISIHFILGISGVIITEASLGFLGLGGSDYSWGVLLSYSKDVLLEAPHMVLISGIALAGLIIGLNLMGDGYRDYLDPKNIEGEH